MGRGADGLTGLGRAGSTTGPCRSWVIVAGRHLLATVTGGRARDGYDKLALRVLSW